MGLRPCISYSTFGLCQIWVCQELVSFSMLICRVRCTEYNGARARYIACLVFNIWEGQEWVLDHGL